MRAALPCVLFVGLLTRSAAAQIPLISEIFSKVTDVNSSFGVARLVGANDVAADNLRTVGFEVTLTVASIGCLNATPAAKSHDFCRARADEGRRRSDTREACELSGDSLPTQGACRALRERESAELTNRVVKVRRGDSTIVSSYSPKKSSSEASVPILDVEIGLAYGRLTGFRSGSAAYTLSGTVEEFPTVSTYFDFLPQSLITPYLGFRAGLTGLSAFRAYTTTDSVYTGTGSTYLLGLALGAAVGTGKVSAYAEYDVTYRQFPSVEWSPVGGRVPASLARQLRLSTQGLSFGLQLKVR